MGDKSLEEELFAACEIGNAAKSEMILSQAATRPSELARSKNDDGWCPVAVAAYKGHLEVVELLVARRQEEYK